MPVAFDAIPQLSALTLSVSYAAPAAAAASPARGEKDGRLMRRLSYEVELRHSSALRLVALDVSSGRWEQKK